MSDIDRTRDPIVVALRRAVPSEPTMPDVALLASELIDRLGLTDEERRASGLSVVDLARAAYVLGARP